MANQPSFFDRYIGKRGAPEMLTGLGQGLLMASQHNLNWGQRLGYMAGGAGQGMRGSNAARMLDTKRAREAEKFQMEKQLFDMKMMQAEQTQAEKDRQAAWSSRMFGPILEEGGASPASNAGLSPAHISLLRGMPPEAAQKAMTSMLLAKTQGGFNLGPGQTRYDAAGKEIVSRGDNPGYGKQLFDEKVGKFYQVGPKGKRHYVSQPSGMEISVGPDGQTTISTGVPRTGSGLGRRGTGEAETKLMKLGDSLSILNDMEKRYHPEFLQIGTKWEMLGARWKDKLGIPLDPLTEKQLRQFTEYRSTAAQNFSTVLNQISGVAVNPTEFKRAEAWLPNAGTGIFDGDSPIEMKEKAARIKDFTQRAMAKYHYITKNGLTIHDVDVQDIPDIMERRREKLEDEYTKKGYAGKALDKLVLNKVAEEFGLSVGK